MLSGYIGERIRMTDDKLLGGGGDKSVFVKAYDVPMWLIFS